MMKLFHFSNGLDLTANKGAQATEHLKKSNIKELINIQDKKGEVKPYQIEQVVKVVEKYGLMQEE